VTVKRTKHATDQVRLTQAYALLRSLRVNLPEVYEIDPRFIEEYNGILRELEKVSGFDLRRFAIGESDRFDYLDKRYCDSRLMKARMDGVLGFFDIIWSPRRPRVGFSPPNG
jgi:hypothetical protein